MPEGRPVLHCACGSCRAEAAFAWDRVEFELFEDMPELRNVEDEATCRFVADKIFERVALDWLRGSCPRVVPPARRRGYPVQAVKGEPA